MFYIISKILKVFVMPLSWIVGLLIAAAFVKKKRLRNGLTVAALALLLLFTDKPFLQVVQYQTTRQYAHQPVPTQHYSVAVIMGGFGSMNTSVGQFCSFLDRDARLWESVRLLKMGVVDKLLISGDQTVAEDKEGHTTEVEFRKYLAEMGIADSCLLVEPFARNTRENATYSIALLDSLGYTSQDCLLVTSATHLKRSEDCFAAEGWKLEPYAVNIYSKPAHLKVKDYFPSWQAANDWNELVNEWVGNAVYKIVGYSK